MSESKTNTVQKEHYYTIYSGAIASIGMAESTLDPRYVSGLKHGKTEDSATGIFGIKPSTRSDFFTEDRIHALDPIPKSVALFLAKTKSSEVFQEDIMVTMILLDHHVKRIMTYLQKKGKKITLTNALKFASLYHVRPGTGDTVLEGLTNAGFFDVTDIDSLALAATFHVQLMKDLPSLKDNEKGWEIGNKIRCWNGQTYPEQKLLDQFANLDYNPKATVALIE